jgi:hypothetical protein
MTQHLNSCQESVLSQGGTEFLKSIPSLGIMSNRMTEAQGEKILRFTKQLGINQVNVMFDCDDSGAKEALWFFAERQLEVRLVWSPAMHNGNHSQRQPELLSKSELESLVGV